MNTWRYSGHDEDEAAIPGEWVWERLRLQRDALLARSDWTQVADAPVDQIEWQTYRQALRDLPSTVTDPREAVWPDTP